MEKTKITLLMEPFNHDEQVCTFIGSPGILTADADKISQLATLLSWAGNNMIFRSLHNKGAAGIFNDGISQEWRLQRIVKSHAYLHFYNRPDEDCPSGKHLLHNPESMIPSELTDYQYHVLARILSELNTVDIPIAGDIREIYQVMISGIKSLKPSSIVFFYENWNDKDFEAMDYGRNLCKEQDIPFFDRAEWMEMLY
ncbi:MAG: hypothetical protein WAT21_07570 [Saprospiraceae bacterium]